jgi:hypothetical protein
MILASRTLFLTSLATLMLVTTIHGQDQRNQRGETMAMRSRAATHVYMGFLQNIRNKRLIYEGNM